MFSFLLSVIVLGALTVSTSSIPTVELNCKAKQNTICYNSRIEILLQGVQIQKNDDAKYETLFIEDARVEFLPVNIGTAFPDLKYLKVVGSSVKVIEKLNFEGLKMVKEVKLERNLISNLLVDVFEPLENLRRINLNFNKISSLPSKIFASNTKLVSILAAGNAISIISDQAFKNLVSLKSLDISNNQIEDLYSGTFADCAELKTVWINNNRLRFVPENIFEKNTKLAVAQKQFENNTCLNDFLDKETIDLPSDLKRAFNENCKPLCFNEVDNLRGDVANLTAQLKEASKVIEGHKKTLDKKENELKTSNDDLESCNKDKEELNQDLKTCKDQTDSLESNILSLNQQLKDNQDAIAALKKAEDDRRSTIDSCDLKMIQLNSTIDAQSREIEKCQKEKNDFLLFSIAGFRNASLISSDLNVCSNLNKDLTKQLEIANQTIEETAKILNETRKDLVIKNLALDGVNLNKIQCSQSALPSNESKLNQEAAKLEEQLKTSTPNEAACRSELDEVKATNLNLTQALSQLKESEITQNPEPSISIDCQVGKDGEYLTCGVNNVKAASRNAKAYDIEEKASLKDVNGLKFTDSTFIDFPVELVKKFENFRYFEATDSVFLNFNDNICEYSSKIEKVAIKSSHIGSSIKLDSCESLKHLQIENSGIREISAANPIISVIKIQLNGNKIQQISNQLFSNFQNVKSIELLGNKIESIDGNTFDGNTALETVNLSDNPIRKISGPIFTNNKQLSTVFMKNCRCINEDAMGMSKIEKIKNNLLTKCR